MGIYGSYAKQLMEQNNIESRADQMTLEEFKDSLLEAYSSVFESIDEEDTEAVTEGANIDMTKQFMESKKTTKEHLKAYKKALKAKDFKGASAELGAVEKILKDSRDKIKAIDADSVGSSVLGFFANYIIYCGEMLIPSTLMGFGLGVAKSGAMDAMFSFSEEELKKAGAKAAAGVAVSSVGYVVAIIKLVIILVKDIKTFVGELKSDKEVTAKNFNLYRNKLLRFTDDMIKQVGKLKDKVASAKAKEEK